MIKMQKYLLQSLLLLWWITPLSADPGIWNRDTILVGASTHPSPFLGDILESLTFLPRAESQTALAEMSGEQHTPNILLIQEVSHQFVRRLYDPLRALAITPSLCDPCHPGKRDFCECQEWSLWAEAGGGGQRLKGNCTAHGLNANGYEFTFGAHRTFFDWFTLGFAGSYANTLVHYGLGGTNNINCYMTGLYALLRPECFYILVDLAYGYSRGNLRRSIHIGDTLVQARSRPQITDFTFYAEFGLDFYYWDFAIQPFYGVEVDTLWRKKIKENHANDLNLLVDEAVKTYTVGNLGVHIAYNICDFTFGFDVAWLYRFTSVENSVSNMFPFSTTFFEVTGVPLDRNSVEGTFYLMKNVSQGWNVFAKVTTQAWSRFASYDALIGIESHW